MIDGHHEGQECWVAVPGERREKSGWQGNESHFFVGFFVCLLFGFGALKQRSDR